MARASVLLAQNAAPPQNGTPGRAAHPRLVVPDSELPRLQALIRDNAPARRLAAEVRREGERLLNAPPLESRAFPRLTGESRRILERIYLFGLLYRLEHETAYLTRAVRELTSAIQSDDANPPHFVESSELTLALAVGYDWFWPELKPEERDLLRQAIVAKGLQAALPFYEKQAGWAAAPGGANVVVNAAMGMAALAVADDEPELSATILKHVADSMGHSFAAAGPEGAWIDGPGSWSSATRYAVCFLASLEISTGALHDASMLRGLERAARFRVYSRGPLGRTFAYGPGPEISGASPEMFWLSRRLHQPAFAWSEQRELARRPVPEALDLIWLVRDPAPPQPPAWPLDALFPAQQRAFLRGSWDDPESIFLAVKGGDGRAARGHRDLGSFVLDALGVRWALEAEPPPKPQRGSEDLPPNAWHNTVSIDGAGQDPGAEVRIVGHEFTSVLAWAALDLTRAYASKVKLWERRVGLAQRQGVLIEDRIRAGQPVEATWSMLTDAEIAFSGQTALLNKGGALLAAEIQTPRHAVFDVTQAGPNKRRLVASLGEKTAEVDLNILLTPYRAGQPKPKITARFPD